MHITLYLNIPLNHRCIHTEGLLLRKQWWEAWSESLTLESPVGDVAHLRFHLHLLSNKHRYERCALLKRARTMLLHPLICEKYVSKEPGHVPKWHGHETPRARAEIIKPQHCDFSHRCTGRHGASSDSIASFLFLSLIVIVIFGV